MKKPNKANRYGPAQGTYEEGKALLGVRSPTNFGACPVNDVRVLQFCSQIEDGNPSYWDAAEATRIWGRPVAPPALLQAMPMPLPWRPDREVELDFMLMNLPLPGSTIINVSTDITYHRPIYQGETINFWDEAVEISEEKDTRLGVGCFVTTVSHYQNQSGEPVATAVNVQFRFTPRSSPGSSQ
jgi:hypothetical protein